ncbi:homeobox KN domain-containing protein [Favolaschia claudopus]|uniref:Homeobox KN domain-containing protein n=1 Tax=Favolaschia claudopus TaxID=2862362 RepID=A0AAW0ATZ8_9AGAR
MDNENRRIAAFFDTESSSGLLGPSSLTATITDNPSGDPANKNMISRLNTSTTTAISTPFVGPHHRGPGRGGHRPLLPKPEQYVLRHAPYPPSHARQDYNPLCFPVPHRNANNRGSLALLTDLRFDNASATFNATKPSPNYAAGIMHPSQLSGMAANSLKGSTSSAGPQMSPFSASAEPLESIAGSDCPLPFGAFGGPPQGLTTPVQLYPQGSSQDAKRSGPPNRQQRKGGKFPKATTELLKAWLRRHFDNPYPSEEQKKGLSHATGLSISQISNWMINARRRIPSLADKRRSLPDTASVQLYDPMGAQSISQHPCTPPHLHCACGPAHRSMCTEPEINHEVPAPCGVYTDSEKVWDHLVFKLSA